MIYKAILSDDKTLEHHGISGQKWGVKHGPPYPLSNQSTSGRKTVKSTNKSKLASNNDVGGFTNYKVTKINNNVKKVNDKYRKTLPVITNVLNKRIDEVKNLSDVEFAELGLYGTNDKKEVTKYLSDVRSGKARTLNNDQFSDSLTDDQLTLELYQAVFNISAKEDKKEYINAVTENLNNITKKFNDAIELLSKDDINISKSDLKKLEKDVDVYIKILSE